MNTHDHSTDNERTIWLGVGAGFARDRADPAVDLVSRGKHDVIARARRARQAALGLPAGHADPVE